MNFGDDLEVVFEKLTEGVLYHEEELSTKLQDAFIFLGEDKYCGIVNIIHGDRSFVRYTIDPQNTHGARYSILNPHKTVPFSEEKSFVVELGDMMFLVYNNSQARLTILQNKRANTVRNNGDALQFNADLNQLLLLTFRPRVQFMTKDTFLEKAFGEDVLRKAILPSVGSYGVFYNNNGRIDMQYYPANRIRYSTNVYKRKQIVQFGPMIGERPFHFNQYNRVRGYNEIIGTKSISEFANNLVEMHIGTPICDKEFENLMRLIEPFTVSPGIERKNISGTDYRRAPQMLRERQPIISCCKTMILINDNLLNNRYLRNRK